MSLSILISFKGPNKPANFYEIINPSPFSLFIETNKYKDDDECI